ncbi:hypothetical protein HDV06_006259 [Boothiomyces sp. JEL0866]|nr:hypothetical protein HDV06_006259 [Boothiomyces sp. JEL0866]
MNTYKLKFRQEIFKARSCGGISAPLIPSYAYCFSKYRYPMLVLEVQFENPQAKQEVRIVDVNTNQNADFFPISGINVPNYSGAAVIPPTILTDPLDGLPKLFFVFDDVGFRFPGKYRLFCTLVDVASLKSTTIKTSEFQVLSRRDFRNPKENTVLEKSFAIQGIVDKTTKRYKKTHLIY